MKRKTIIVDMNWKCPRIKLGFIDNHLSRAVHGMYSKEGIELTGRCIACRHLVPTNRN